MKTYLKLILSTFCFCFVLLSNSIGQTEKDEALAFDKIVEKMAGLNSVPYRGATKEDLVGAWKQIAVKPGAIKNLEDPWYSQNQIFLFLEEGYVKSLIFPDGENMNSHLKELEEAQASTQWELLGEEGLTQWVYSNAEKTTYHVLCTYCKNTPKNSSQLEGVKEGDIILTYLDTDTKEAQFYRLLRRVEEPKKELASCWMPKVVSLAVACIQGGGAKKQKLPTKISRKYD